jgi:general stress protein 26
MSVSQTQEIIGLLTEGRDLTLATLRPDGFPQATTVSYASDGMTIYFAVGQDSQKAGNLSRDHRVSLTVNLPYDDWNAIRGLSMGATAERVDDPTEIAHIGQLFVDKFHMDLTQYAPGDLQKLAFFRIKPRVVSILDYRKGFGHSDLVKAEDLVRAGS